MKAGYDYTSGNYLHYKDYFGSVEFSVEDAVFHGKVVGIKPLISFEGDSVSAITEDFQSSIDEYLDFCARNGRQPEKSLMDSYCVWIDADLHRKAVLAASEHGMSLNTLVEDAILQKINCFGD